MPYGNPICKPDCAQRLETIRPLVRATRIFDCCLVTFNDRSSCRLEADLVNDAVRSRGISKVRSVGFLPWSLDGKLRTGLVGGILRQDLAAEGRLLE